MDQSASVYHWLPRIIGILAILFISLFAADSFESGVAFGHQLKGFLLHLVPSFILAIFLTIAWKWELFGGILFVLISIGFCPFIYNHNYAINHSILMSFGIILAINGPIVLIGILFIISHIKKKRLVIS